MLILLAQMTFVHRDLMKILYSDLMRIWKLMKTWRNGLLIKL